MKILLASMLMLSSLTVSAAGSGTFENSVGTKLTVTCDGHTTPSMVIVVPRIFTLDDYAQLDIGLNGFYENGEPRRVYFVGGVDVRTKEQKTVISSMVEGDNLYNLLKTDYANIRILTFNSTEIQVFEFKDTKAKLARLAADCGYGNE